MTTLSVGSPDNTTTGEWRKSVVQSLGLLGLSGWLCIRRGNDFNHLGMIVKFHMTLWGSVFDCGLGGRVNCGPGRRASDGVPSCTFEQLLRWGVQSI